VIPAVARQERTCGNPSIEWHHGQELAILDRYLSQQLPQPTTPAELGVRCREPAEDAPHCCAGTRNNEQASNLKIGTRSQNETLVDWLRCFVEHPIAGGIRGSMPHKWSPLSAFNGHRQLVNEDW